MTTMNPSTNVAALKSNIREYVQLLTLLKKKKGELKTMSTALRDLSDNILDRMIDQNIPHCSSSGHTFTVREKSKLKSATAKNVLVQVQEFFQLSDAEMERFVTMADSKRKAEAELITSLECKSLKKKADQEEDRSSIDDIEGISSVMSSAIDDMYP